MEPIYIPAYERLVVNMRDMLNEDVYQAMWADGYSMPLEDAMRYAQHMDEE